MIQYEKLFSKNAHGMKRSEIRELLKVTRKPDIISFAGGLPAPEVFPIDEIKEITVEVLEREGKTALQYGPTEGDRNLKEQLKEHMKEEGIDVDIDSILIISASQQGLDLISKVFLDRKDTVIVGEPTYVGGIQAFNSYGARMVPVPLDDEGMITEKLEETINFLKKDPTSTPIKFIYVIPDFQNPSGITMSEDRRKELIEIAEKYKLIIIEDTPYRQLRYSGESVTPIYTLDKYGRTISLFTFSKIFIPGFRLGWLIGPSEIVEKLVIAKQSTDLCTAPFTQAISAEFLKRGLLKKQISIIKEVYRRKRDLMLKYLDEYMPKLEGLKWTKPDGGLFLWVTLPEYMDARELFIRALDRKVAYVIGEAFHPQAKCKNAFRLNFSYPSEEHIKEGVIRLSKAIEEYEKEIKDKKLRGETVFP